MDMNKQAVNLFLAVGVAFAAIVGLPTETVARHNQATDNLLVAQAKQGWVTKASMSRSQKKISSRCLYRPRTQSPFSRLSN